MAVDILNEARERVTKLPRVEPKSFAPTEMILELVKRIRTDGTTRTNTR